MKHEKSQELNNIIKNIYLGVNASILDTVIEKASTETSNIAIFIDQPDICFKKIYSLLCKNRLSRFFFVYSIDIRTFPQTEETGRFFFLSNYIHQNGQPVIGMTNQSKDHVAAHFTNWCEKQEATPPCYCSVEEVDPDKGDFIYVEKTKQPFFLSYLIEKLTNLEWISRKIIFSIASREDIMSLSAYLLSMNASIAEKNTNSYTILKTISHLETEVGRLTSTIRFQEMEINNQKLYIQLIRGTDSIALPILAKNDGQISKTGTKSDIEHLYEIGRLKNEIAWYKRTYEQRSVLGVLKEKIKQKIKNKN